MSVIDRKLRRTCVRVWAYAVGVRAYFIIAFCVGLLAWLGTDKIYFVSLPGWFVTVAYVIPKEGSQVWFDSFTIPKDAPHPAEAHAFIDYLLRPEVAAKNSNFVGYANGNLASQKLLDKAVLDDRTVYPDAATMAGLYIITAHDQKTQRLMNTEAHL